MLTRKEYKRVNEYENDLFEIYNPINILINIRTQNIEIVMIL